MVMLTVHENDPFDPNTFYTPAKVKVNLSIEWNGQNSYYQSSQFDLKY